MADEAQGSGAPRSAAWTGVLLHTGPLELIETQWPEPSEEAAEAVLGQARAWYGAASLVLAVACVCGSVWAMVTEARWAWWAMLGVGAADVALGVVLVYADTQASVRRAMVTLAWRVRTGLLWLARLLQRAPKRVVREGTHRVPVELELDAEANPPHLRWRWRCDRAEVARRHRDALVSREAPATEGEAQLTRAGIAWELARDPVEPDVASLMVRDPKTGAALVVMLARDALPEGVDMASLPRLRRRGVQLPQAQQRALLGALSEIAEVSGVASPLPATAAVMRSPARGGAVSAV